MCKQETEHLEDLCPCFQISESEYTVQKLQEFQTRWLILGHGQI